MRYIYSICSEYNIQIKRAQHPGSSTVNCCRCESLLGLPEYFAFDDAETELINRVDAERQMIFAG
jgi:hypothetical protein